MSTLLVVFIGVIFSIVTLNHFSIPYLLITIFWFSLFTVYTLKSKTTTKKAVWFNLAFAALLLGVLEGYSYFSIKAQNDKNSYRYEGGYTKGYFISNEILGYGPAINRIITVKKFYEDKLLYNVTYTIGGDGRRITPQAKSRRDNQCIILFGGSFTFGEGVNDHETVPYIVGKLQNCKVHNYGFHGYGPHQMLAAIEHGLINCKPKLVIYQALKTHVTRAAGYASWDIHGPKYLLKNGKLTLDGHFDDNPEMNSFEGWIKRKIFSQSNKSYLYRKFFQTKDRYTIKDDDIDLFIEIVNNSKGKLAHDFPDSEFHIILWDNQSDDNAFVKIDKRLRMITGNLHLISDILPDFHEHPEKYQISDYDRHPNAFAYKLISDYVVKNILGESLQKYH